MSPCQPPPETLDTAWYTANRNRKGHRSPDQHDRFQAWTVSSCSPKFVVIHRGWLPAQQRPAVSPARRGARFQRAVSPFVATSRRHDAVARVRPKLLGQEDHPPAAVFALLLRAAVEVRSTGARGASKKTAASAERDKKACKKWHGSPCLPHANGGQSATFRAEKEEDNHE